MTRLIIPCPFPLGVVNPPSRILPQRSWAASVPTLLSHDALFKLLTPGLLPAGSNTGGATALCCPMERFLGCVFLRRHMGRVVQSEESVSISWKEIVNPLLYERSCSVFRPEETEKKTRK